MRKFRLNAPCLLLGLLSGCAAAAVRAPVAAPAAPVAGTTAPGRIADVREVDIGAGDGSRAGVDAVLAALQQPAAPAKLDLQEIVINQPGGVPVSLGGVYPGFAAGNRVTIIAGPSTRLVPAD